jgi:hypothetical protein
MRKFEGSLGADLSGVRVHTGGESATAASAVGARAFATGQDIHFGAGQYDPVSSEGQHLLAHEVAHTVQQRGGNPSGVQYKLEVSAPGDAFEHEADHAAAAMVSGAPASVSTASGIMRKPDAQAHATPPGQSLTPPDMTPMEWKMGAGTGPTTPTPIKIAVGAVPLPQGVTSDPTAGGSQSCDYKPQPDSVFHPKPHYPLSVFDSRRAAWDALTASAQGIETIYNAAIPSIAAFNNASKDPALKDLYEFQQDGKDGKNMHQVANEQVVPKSSSSGKTVADDFKKVGGVSVGTQANTAGLENNLKAAAKSEKVEAAITALHGKEAALAATVDGMTQANSEASAAAHRLTASNFVMAEVKADDDKAEAQDKKDEITAKIAAIKGYVDGAVKVVSFVAGALAAPEAAAVGGLIQLGDQVGAYKPTDASPPTPGQAAAGTVKKGADGAASGISMVAEKVLNYIYASDLNAQNANIAKATAAYRTARAGAAKESWLADCDELTGKLAGVHKSANLMKAALMERKTAYQALATAAATAGGGSQEQQDRIKALIMAIPVAKAVVAQTSNVLNAVNNEPVAGTGSQIGAHMSVAAKQATVLDMATYYGHILGYRSEFQDHYNFWSARVTSLEGVIGKLGG